MKYIGPSLLGWDPPIRKEDMYVEERVSAIKNKLLWLSWSSVASLEKGFQSTLTISLMCKTSSWLTELDYICIYINLKGDNSFVEMVLIFSCFPFYSTLWCLITFIHAHQKMRFLLIIFLGFPGFPKQSSPAG